MFTVKVLKRTEVPGINGEPPTYMVSTMLTEASVVHVNELRFDTLSCVMGTDGNGDSFCYYIANPDLPKPEGFTDDTEFGFAAYIENSHGATTERVVF